MVTKIQRDYIDSLTLFQRAVVVADWKKQIDIIALSATKAAKEKRDDLQARIDYAESIAKRRPAPKVR